MATSVDVTWQLDDIRMDATVVRPDGDGPFPAVVLVAGSGPTDRDWCSPLIPGSNGSGRMFADACANAGIASIRYDKRASGPHAIENAMKMVGSMSMKSHLDELVAAVGALAEQDFVDSSRMVGLGNSEGTLHVLHYVEADEKVPLAGIVLAAPPGRTIQDVLLAQLTLQSAALPNGDELMAKVREAAARYSVGEPMNPDPEIPESVRMVLASFENPANLPLARELWVESAVGLLAEVRIPTLVLIGGKDIQIDARADGDPLRAAAEGVSNVTFAFPANANHVFQEDTRPITEIAASRDPHYNAPDSHLDSESLGIIVDWITGITRVDG